MIYIYHGEDNLKSREYLHQHLSSLKEFEIIRFDSKDITQDKVNMSINGISLIPQNKVLVLSNFFSVSKPIFDKVAPILSNSVTDILIWQDKKLTPTQLKIFPKSTIKVFEPEKFLFNCLYSIKPKNFKVFSKYYEQVITSDQLELFFYFLKNHIKKLSTQTYPFDQKTTKRVFLQLVELEHQQKSGLLSTPKDIAISRIIFHLIG